MGNDNENINVLTLKYADEELMKRLKFQINCYLIYENI